MFRVTFGVRGTTNRNVSTFNTAERAKREAQNWAKTNAGGDYFALLETPEGKRVRYEGAPGGYRLRQIG